MACYVGVVGLMWRTFIYLNQLTKNRIVHTVNIRLGMHP